ncbi:hypothetical protein Tco_0986183 [Tanacetum coccineum]
MDDPNITIEEYIRLEEEKAQKHGKVFNWETAKYGKIWYDKDVHDLRSVETEFLAIAFNDRVSPEKTLSCEPMVSSLNDEINFKISFDDSDDEDYTVMFDKNLFSYKIISTNGLKMDSENDNEKVNMPSLPPPEPTVSYFDDLDFFEDFENEFPAIVYNNAPTYKSDLLTEPILSPQHINEFDLKDETSLSEYDEEEQNVLYFNDLFPFNIIHPDMALLPRDQRHQYLRYKRLQYTDVDIEDFETRLARIYRRELHRVQVFDFGGLSDLMAEGLSARKPKEFGEAVLDLDTPRALLDGDCWIQCILGREREADPGQKGSERLLDRDLICLLLGGVLEVFCYWEEEWGSYLWRTVMAQLAEHFGLLTEERLQGLMVIAPALSVIDMAELVMLQICVEIDDTWAWVALGPERRPDAAAGAPEAAEDAPVIEEGGQGIPAPVQAPPLPPAASRTMPQRMTRLEEDVHEIRGALANQRELIGAMARDFSRFIVWATSGIAQLLDSARVTYTPYSETRIPYQCRVRQRTGEASTSTAQQDQQQPDP